MAGGKLSPRQKMINLMYLVFIAMLALNMSKEVLSAFGLMNERINESNESATVRNAAFMRGLAEKVDEQPAKYKPLMEKAEQVDKLSTEFNAYVETLKTDLLKTVDDPKKYEEMDKTHHLDEKWFNGDNVSKAGQEFLARINTYREGVIQVLGEDNKDIQADIMKKFATQDEKTADGIKKGWLNYHFEGFPMVASLTKLTQMQADVKTIESEVLSSMLAGKLKVEASLTNFDAIVVPDKTAFFSGEEFTGTIILGKKDQTLRADKVIINGKELSPDAMQAGKTILKFPAGAVGEREIVGEFQFKEGDSIISIPVKSSYAVVPKPNSATISADKMNVVYRGVDNPMTISFAGVSDNNVTASAPGLSKASGTGKYVMRPGSGKDVTIIVNGKLPDGQPVNDKATFRIKDIPKPSGTIAGQPDNVSLPKNNVEIATINAKLFDFDFDLDIDVTSFKMKVPGQPTVTVNGNRMNDQAKSALRKASRGDAIQIFEIKSQIKGNSSIKLLPASPVFIEISN
ncbi:gliding motility-associated protein GldM [Gelidibacter algens]|jgi:gliding motility-associated protein GldM|uniref:Gliding motility-associated protein GldM n=1 Tax=Gelidibacter algens TaxID=49280 RepID=A0A1A7QWU6_9FLAO|nr:gliding motility protein GldM [Gelidibacter algens]OBX23007.1 gliding motility protein GldM [Gelidibacter algens]RAJ19898.1 gliding motility-associated protein GldM [Gelidibacter algens]